MDIPAQQPNINHSIEQPLPSQTSNKKGLIIPIIGVLILLIIIITGAFLLGQKTTQKASSSNTPQLTSTPISSENNSSTIIPTSISTKSNQLRAAGLVLNYPESWIPIFAKENGETAVYFAKDQEEAQTLVNCVSKNYCSSYSLKLEDFGNAAVWQSHTIEAFIKEVKKDIKIDELQKTTIAGHEAWWGYVNNDKFAHQTVISTGTPKEKGFIAIKATGTNKQMMDEYVSNLSNILINKYESVQPKDLSVKKGFIIELTSSLVTDDYSLLPLILDNLLSPQNSTKNYYYLLYTESKTDTSGNTIGGYPRNNFLNYKYYLLTDNDQLKDDTYETPQIKIKVSNSNIKDLGSYLAEPKYCQQDTDCQYRSNFCIIDAYNAYHQFYTPWGCGPPEYKNLGHAIELQEKLNCTTDIEVKYDSLKCINNSCQAINPKPVCKK